MKKANKIIFALLCVFTIGAVSLNSAFAAVTEHYSQSATVSGGKITAHATYYQSGDKRWSVIWAHLLSNYNNVKSSGVKTIREWKDEYTYIVGGQLYKVDYSYMTINLGSHTFTFKR